MFWMELAWEEGFQNEGTLFVDFYQRKPRLQMVWKSLYPKTCQLHYSHAIPEKCLLNLFFKGSSNEHSTIPFAVWLKSNLNLSYSINYFFSWFYECDNNILFLK